MKTSCFTLRLVLILFSLSSFAVAREDLSYQTFQNGDYVKSVDMSAYAPSQDASLPTQTFEGYLQLSGNPTFKIINANKYFVPTEEIQQTKTLPTDFNYEFIQDNDVLIPVKRGPIPSNHTRWEYVLEPGRVWNEPNDNGFSRAAIPFSLVERNANCTHNGVLMFLFKTGGEISRVAMQISSETCYYLQFDAFGLLNASYLPATIANKQAIISAYNDEIAQRLPTRPIASLSTDFPSINTEHFAIGKSSGNTRTGLIFKGIHYTSNCPTRHGNYPYCDALNIPSYSTAKSVTAAIALMRIEQLFSGTANLPVSKYALNSGCQKTDWQGVSFGHLLDMSTGQYDSTDYMADEDSAKIAPFFITSKHSNKLNYSCNAYQHKTQPGKTWVYHTSDSYLLGSVLNVYWRNLPGKQGQEVFNDVLIKDIYTPLHLSQTALVTRRSDDNFKQAFFGWGLTLIADDIAKLSIFLGADKGRLNNEQILDVGMLDAAVQRDENNRGLQTAGLKNFRYQHGFWARNVQNEIGCKNPTWVPFMSGFGGITVALFPNGVVWYNIADDGLLSSIDFAKPAIEAAKFGSYCQ